MVNILQHYCPPPIGGGLPGGSPPGRGRYDRVKATASVVVIGGHAASSCRCFPRARFERASREEGFSLPPSAAGLADFICGANREEFHLTGVNWERDCPPGRVEDLRRVVEGDPSPDGQGSLQIKRGIEVGHIFQLGSKYSEAMGARVLDENGKNVTMTMGCYGIGISRIVAAAIEQNHDDNGIIWPASMAPFQLAIIPLNLNKSAAVAACAEQLYQELQATGIELLMDDRNERPGVKFADMELIGVPHRIVIGDRALAEGKIEYKGRRDTDSELVAREDIVEFIKARLR